MNQVWPEEKFKTPYIELQGRAFTPNSDSILYQQDDLVVKVKLTTTDWNKEAIQEKRAHEDTIYKGKLAKVKEYLLSFFLICCC